MTWRPISESGIEFEFNDTFGTVSIDGSVVTAPFNSGPSWNIVIGDGTVDYSIRITVQSYESEEVFDEEVSAFRFEVAAGGETFVDNENTGNTTEFAPNPVTGNGCVVDYIPGNGVETVRSEAYTILIELDVQSSPRIKPILQTFRGYMGADNVFTTWVRTEEGRADLSAAAVTIKVKPYSRPGKEVATVTATADENGRVDFTVTGLTTTQQLAPGLFRLELLADQGDTTQVVQVGLLELC